MVVKETLGPSDYCLSLQEKRKIIQILLDEMDTQQKQKWFDANMELAKKYFKKTMKKKTGGFSCRSSKNRTNDIYI